MRGSPGDTKTSSVLSPERNDPTGSVVETGAKRDTGSKAMDETFEQVAYPYASAELLALLRHARSVIRKFLESDLGR